MKILDLINAEGEAEYRNSSSIDVMNNENDAKLAHTAIFAVN